MAKYIRDPNTGALYLKDKELVALREQQESVDNSMQGLQDQINTLSAKLEKLSALIHTGQKWQRTLDQI